MEWSGLGTPAWGAPLWACLSLVLPLGCHSQAASHQPSLGKGGPDRGCGHSSLMSPWDVSVYLCVVGAFTYTLGRRGLGVGAQSCKVELVPGKVDFCCVG